MTGSLKIFISGVAGFLGSHLADAHTRSGDKVVGCDNMIGGDLHNLPEGIHFEEADCGDVETMKALLCDVDLVYHCGAIATEGLSVFSPAIIAKHVYENTAGLLAAAASKKVKRFVYCSSMARYGEGEASVHRGPASSTRRSVWDRQIRGRVTGRECLRDSRHGTRHCRTTQHHRPPPEI